jgi:hypothetical protein
MLLLSNILVLQPKNAQENKFEENVPHHQTLFFIDQGLETVCRRESHPPEEGDPCGIGLRHTYTLKIM